MVFLEGRRFLDLLLVFMRTNIEVAKGSESLSLEYITTYKLSTKPDVTNPSLHVTVTGGG